MKMSEEESNLAQKMEAVSLQMDSEGQTPSTEKAKAKASSSTEKAQQTEGFLIKSDSCYMFLLSFLATKHVRVDVAGRFSCAALLVIFAFVHC